MRRREKVRNAEKARNSFVTRKAETKIAVLAQMLAAAAGENWRETESETLRRTLRFTGFRYLKFLQLIYNWENRFLSVNYNLQLLSEIPTDSIHFREVHDCRFSLKCTQSGLRGKRTYAWESTQWNGEVAQLAAYQRRLCHPLILERLNTLDIMEMKIWHEEGSGYWRISCESIIGSATWLLIPPVLSMIAPKKEECIMLLELFEMLGDAVANNV